MFLKDKNSFNVDWLDGKHAENTANNIPVLDSNAKLPIAVIPTGTSSSTVAIGNHTHTYPYFGITNTTSSNGYGISLYGGASAGAPSYGMMFQGTATFGKHGNVQGDWATYFTMGGDNSRGWIFKSGNGSGGNAASISALGIGTFKGINVKDSSIAVATIENTGTGASLLVLERGTASNNAASWALWNESGNFKLKCNYTNTPGSYYNVLDIAYNTGNIVSKGSVTMPSLILTNSSSATIGSVTKQWLKFKNGDVNGIGVGIGAGGLTVVGSGESTDQVITNIPGTDETLYLTSDQNIVLASNMQGGWTSRKTVEIRTDGEIYVGGNKVVHAGSMSVHKWTVAGKCATWSRICQLKDAVTTGHSGFLNIRGTRGSVVFNVTLIINMSHSQNGNIVQLNNVSYSNLQVRLVVDNSGNGFIELFDNANSATNTTTQNYDISYTNLTNKTLVKYTSFTDGTTLPTGHLERGKITTVSGNMLVANLTGNATTSTKLQTARQINGTNFDGSANITTAKWGTARTLTLSGAVSGSASIDGSGNVTLTTTGNSGVYSASFNNVTYMKLFTVVVRNQYVNKPITFDLLSRSTNHAKTSMLLKFVNTSSIPGTTVQSFYYTGNNTFGDTAKVYKISSDDTSATFEVWIKQCEGYDSVLVANLSCENMIKPTFNGTTSATLPTTFLAETNCSLGTLTGNLTGNAGTSSKWLTARTITLSGSVTGSVNIDGSANVTISTTTNHTHDKIVHTDDVTASITVKDNSNHTWFRNSSNLWTFQGGTSGDDWTQSFQIALQAAGSTANAVWAEIGQQKSNSADGRYRGLAVVKYTGSAKAGGDLSVAQIYGYSGTKRAIQMTDGWLRLNPDNAFTSGIYCNTGVFRTDGNLQVGSSGSTLNVTTSAFTYKNVNVMTASGGTFTGKLTMPNNQMSIKFGDDVEIGDLNVANHLVVQGVQNATLGGITFGSAKDTNIYRGGTNLLKTDDTFNAVGGFQWNGTSLDEKYSDRSLMKNNYVRVTVEGEANKYYPVLINLSKTAFAFVDVSISRSYSWAAPDTWNTATHRGGLTFTLKWTGDSSWGGNDKTLVVEEFNETYTTMVAGMTLSTNGLIVWLRGGNALYQIDSVYGRGMTAVAYTAAEGFTDSGKNVYTARTNVDNVNTEIRAKWTRRSNTLYDNNNRVYSASNKPSATDLGVVSATGDYFRNTKFGANCFSLASNFADVSNGSPWYGLGRGDYTLGGSGTAIQLAGYFGLRLKSNSVTMDLACSGTGVKIATSSGYVQIGAKNTSYCHYDTDRPAHHFNKEVRIAGEIYAGSAYDKRVYHQGYKPTPADISAVPLTSGGNITIHADSDSSSANEYIDIKAGQNYLRVQSNGSTANSDKIYFNGNPILHAATAVGSTNNTYIAYPKDGRFRTTTPSYTGYLKITLPQTWTNTMMRFAIDIYNYSTNQTCTYFIGGYNYATNAAWTNVSAYSISHISGYSRANLSVRFGHDGTKCAIYIGESTTVWNYPQITVRDITVGYQNNTMDKWQSGWVIGFTTTDLTTLSTTITNPSSHYKATLTRGTYLTGTNYDGRTAQTWAVDATSANTASKVVARDGSGNFAAGTVTVARLSLTGSNTPNIINNDALRVRCDSSITLQDNGGSKGVVFSAVSNYFKPFDASNKVLNLGSTAAKWNNIYGMTGHLESRLMVGGTAAPAITLAVGDSDTGFKWNSDGNFDAFANNVSVVNFTNARVQVKKPIETSTPTGTDILRWSTTTTTNGIRKITDQGGVVIACDSSMYIHAGDSGYALAASAGGAAGTTSEHLHLMSDNNIRLIYALQGGWDTRKEAIFEAGGTTRVPGELYTMNASAAKKVYHEGNLTPGNFVQGTNNTGTTKVTDCNAIWKSGFYEIYNGSNMPETKASWYWMLHAGHTSNKSDYKYGLQIAGENGTRNYFIRTTSVSGTGTWDKVMTQVAGDARYMRQESANGYWGMLANGSNNSWVRTTVSGLIPYQSGGSGALGTSGWPFNESHIKALKSVNNLDGTGGGGTWGSLDIGGSKASWAGFRFTGAGNRYLLFHNTNGESGYFKNDGNALWSWNGSGQLINGSVPWSRLMDVPLINIQKGFNGTGSTYANQWLPIASFRVTGQYGDSGATLIFSDYGNGGHSGLIAKVTVRVKQQSAMGSAPSCSIVLADYLNTNPANWKLVVTSNTASLTEVKLYLKNVISYSNPCCRALVVYGNVSYIDGNYSTGLPSGSQIGTSGTWYNAETVNGYTIGASNTKNRSTIPTIGGDGVMEIGKFIDFHADESNVDYHVRFTCNGSGSLTCSGTLGVASLRINGTSYAGIGYDSSTTDVYIAQETNNWLRLKKNLTMTFGGYNVCLSHWGTGAPSGGDGRPVGTLYLRY